MAKLPKRTAWIAMKHRPKREGKYEGRDRRTGWVLDVYWRKLTDEPKPGWYYRKGFLGPFLLWESAEKDMTAWRGLSAPAQEPGEQKDNAAPLTCCAADQDGECNHAQCPQLRDDEPEKSNRHCPLDNRSNDSDY